MTEHKVKYGQSEKAWWPHRDLSEHAKRLALAPYVRFGPGDRNLQAIVGGLAERVSRFHESADVGLNHALAAVVGEDIPKKKDVLENLNLTTSIVKPHRLASRFDGQGVPVCLDIALMMHLVLERLAQSGSEVVLYRENNKPSFGLVFDHRIFLYEKREWHSFRAFQELSVKKNTPVIRHVYP